MSAEGFAVEVSQGAPSASLRGVMRLESVEAYDTVLAPLRGALLAAPCTYSIDLRELLFLNSSGIRALCELVLLARARQKKLELLLSDAVPWQKKSLPSLARIDQSLKLTVT